MSSPNNKDSAAPPPPPDVEAGFNAAISGEQEQEVELDGSVARLGSSTSTTSSHGNGGVDGGANEDTNNGSGKQSKVHFARAL
jgi:hypothetical protein